MTDYSEVLVVEFIAIQQLFPNVVAYLNAISIANKRGYAARNHKHGLSAIEAEELLLEKENV